MYFTYVHSLTKKELMGQQPAVVVSQLSQTDGQTNYLQNSRVKTKSSLASFDQLWIMLNQLPHDPII